VRGRLAGLALAALLLAGCGAASGAHGRPAGEGDLNKIKVAMTGLFSALEMYAQDHSLAYPDDTKPLVPKYIDAIPRDPLNGEPLLYQKTESGYLLSSSADYTPAGAARGYPQMDQDGFFALKAADFPGEDDEP
jgi:hypothetical protein